MALVLFKKDNQPKAFKKLKEATAITGMDIQDFVNSEPYRNEFHLKRMKQDLNSIK